MPLAEFPCRGRNKHKSRGWIVCIRTTTVCCKVESIFSKNLKWNLYEGFAGKVVSQKLYRIVDGVQETPAIATFSSDVLTYSDNLENEGDKGSKVEYMLAAEEGTTNPYGIKATSNSNIVAAYIDGGLFIPNSFAPKGLIYGNK